MASTPTVDEVVTHLCSLADPANVSGMARFGINPMNTLGIPLPILRTKAKQIGRSHELAFQLWDSRIHEVRILATLIDEPALVSEEQMERWTSEFDSWDICDQCCSNLYSNTRFAYQKALEWSLRAEEFVKRAGFVMMAVLAVHDKNAGDEKLIQFFPTLKSGAVDKRNFVKKSVNWAIRQIGKRNITLNKKARGLCEEIKQMDSSAAHWIAGNALRELNSLAVQSRLSNKE